MNIRFKIITILILSCFLMNAFAPRIVLDSNNAGASVFSKAIKCQSVLLYCTSMSALTLKLVNMIFAKQTGLPVPESQPAPGNQSQQDNDQSSDYGMLSSKGLRNIRKASFSLARLGSGAVRSIYHLSTHGVDSIYNKSIGSQLFVHFYCLIILSMLFLLPRGSIDSSIITRLNKALYSHSIKLLEWLFYLQNTKSVRGHPGGTAS